MGVFGINMKAASTPLCQNLIWLIGGGSWREMFKETFLFENNWKSWGGEFLRSGNVN